MTQRVTVYYNGPYNGSMKYTAEQNAQRQIDYWKDGETAQWLSNNGYSVEFRSWDSDISAGMYVFGYSVLRDEDVPLFYVRFGDPYTKNKGV